MDFKEFLADNVILLQRLQELGQSGQVTPSVKPLVSGLRLREIADPLTWASCFLAFMATKSDHQPSRDPAAYGMIILQLARKHGGNGWILYDWQFRQHCAAGANLPWADLNPSLMAATVIGHSGDHIPPRRSCPLCLSADHTREECALAYIEAAKHPLIHPLGRPNNFPIRRPSPYLSTPDNICRHFDRGTCFSSSCKYEHACSSCYKMGHPEHLCQEEKGKPRGRQGEQTKPPSLPRPNSLPSKTL